MRVLCTCGGAPTHTRPAAQAMIAADENGDHQLSFDEFVRLILDLRALPPPGSPKSAQRAAPPLTQTGVVSLSAPAAGLGALGPPGSAPRTLGPRSARAARLAALRGTSGTPMRASSGPANGDEKSPAASDAMAPRTLFAASAAPAAPASPRPEGGMDGHESLAGAEHASATERGLGELLDCTTGGAATIECRPRLAGLSADPSTAEDVVQQHGGSAIAIGGEVSAVSLGPGGVGEAEPLVMEPPNTNAAAAAAAPETAAPDGPGLADLAARESDRLSTSAPAASNHVADDRSKGGDFSRGLAPRGGLASIVGFGVALGTRLESALAAVGIGGIATITDSFPKGNEVTPDVMREMSELAVALHLPNHRCVLLTGWRNARFHPGNAGSLPAVCFTSLTKVTDSASVHAPLKCLRRRLRHGGPRGAARRIKAARSAVSRKGRAGTISGTR